MKKHVHFGAGAFGLGFTVWIANQNGFKTTIANRASKKSSQRSEHLRTQGHYHIQFFQGEDTKIEIDDFFYIEKNENDIVDQISSPDTSLITTSVSRDGLNGIADILSRGITERAKKAAAKHLFIIPCENGVTGDDLRQKIIDSANFGTSHSDLDQIATFLSCAVDRICREPTIDKNGQLVVKTEKFAELVIEEPNKDIDSLKKLLPENRFGLQYVENLRPYQRRKRWLLNGPHLLIALHAQRDGYSYLHDYLNLSPRSFPILRGIQAELAEIISLLEPNISFREATSYNAIVANRFMAAPDKITRIIHRFTGAERLEAFLADYYDKVTAQAMQYVESGQNFPHMLACTLASCQSLIADQRYAK